MRFLWQRITRGWDDSDTWELDFTIAKFVLPRLKRFKELNLLYPPETTEEQWDKDLDDIIFAMEVEVYGNENKLGPEGWDRVHKGFQLFGKHFRGLWW